MNDRSSVAVRLGTLLPLVLSFSTGLSAQSQFVLDSNALGPIHACDLLSTVNRVFPQARDTVVHGEDDSRWSAKIVHFDRADWVIFESSWIDTTHVWTIRTNSTRFHTRRGYAVGARIGDLIAKREHFTAELAEGQLGLTLVSENVGVGIDPQAAAKFPFDWPAGADATERLDADARITVLAAGRDCRH